MTATAVLAVVCTVASAPAAHGPDTLRTLWNSARSYGEFMGTVDERVAQWRRMNAAAAVPDALAHRARRAGQWRLLAVAEDWCSDSVNILPYLARLAELAPNVQLRIVDSRAGRSLMEAHRTPDDRAATPTIMLLDGDFVVRGCFVERPSELQRWYLETGRHLAGDRLRRQKQQRYDEDAGASTLRETVEMMEAALTGAMRCAGAPSAP